MLVDKLCTCTYALIHNIRTLIPLFLLWGVRCASVVVMCTLLFSHGHRSYITAPRTNSAVRLPRPPSRWSQVRYGKVCKRFREDGRKASKLATGGGGARINYLGAATVAKQTKPGDPLQVQVEPVVPTHLNNSNNSDFGGHTIDVWTHFFLQMDFERNTARGPRFLLGCILRSTRYVVIFDPNGSGIPQFGHSR